MKMSAAAQTHAKIVARSLHSNCTTRGHVRRTEQFNTASSNSNSKGAGTRCVFLGHSNRANCNFNISRAREECGCFIHERREL